MSSFVNDLNPPKQQKTDTESHRPSKPSENGARESDACYWLDSSQVDFGADLDGHHARYGHDSGCELEPRPIPRILDSKKAGRAGIYWYRCEYRLICLYWHFNLFRDF